MNTQIQKTYHNLKTIKIQGATAVSRSIIAAIKNYGLNNKTNNLSLWKRDLKKIANYLLSARPTEPMAQNGVKFIFYQLEKHHPKNIQQAKSILRKSTNQFIFISENAAKKIIPLGKTIIKNGDDVLTHCHSWLVQQILINAKKSGKKFRVFNTETRPLYQGHITAKNLLKAKINTTMVTDSSAGFLISHYSGKELMMEKIIIGADAVLSDGSVINKIGSYAIGASAFLEKVPLYVAAPLLKFYPRPWIKIEQRSAKEVWPNAPKKLKIINFAFDVVPAKWIKGIICEAGIIKPNEAKKFIKKIYPHILN